MARILIVYASRHGQTRKIADRLEAILRGEGHSADLVDASISVRRPIVGYGAYILASAVNYGKHLPAMVRFVREHLSDLESAPSLFLSVSASAASRQGRADAVRCIEEFMNETGWRPTVCLPVAGAMKYTKYPWLMRIMLRAIVKRTGREHSGDTDTSRDYEYTDWEALERFVADFLSVQAIRPSPVLL
ncbi:MAG TPA: flavodoxin domain-containing protein [Fimbriimonadaceae bacterium]|nr:flavodoxin domain-containing protein [Fimbriimonadaceae bacterium]